MKLNDAPDDMLIGKYVQLRDARAQRKKAFESEDAEDKGRQEKIEAELLRRLNDRGTDSTTSKAYGTAYRIVRSSCSVADWDAFFNQWVVPHSAWDFIERRAAKAAVEAYRQDSNDLPPGLNWSEVATIGVRRS